MSETVSNCMPGDDAYNLKRRFQSLKRRGAVGWETLPDFLMWAKETGYFKNAFLRKRDKTKPHGPDNCYWSRVPEPVIPVAERAYKIAAKSNFCEGCTRRDPETCDGCKEWEAWFIENWNKNIYRGNPEKAEVTDGEG